MLLLVLACALLVLRDRAPANKLALLVLRGRLLVTVIRVALVVRGSSPGLPLVVWGWADPISRFVVLWLRRGRLKPGAPEVLERRGLVCPPFTQLPSTLLLRLEGRCMHADMCLQWGLPDPPQSTRCGHPAAAQGWHSQRTGWAG